MASLFGKSGSTRVQIDNGAVTEFINKNKAVRDVMAGVARSVQAAAEATAQDAQNGPDGTLYGYAEAGFDVVFESGSGRRRPRFLIISRADPDMFLRVYFYTQKRDGITHLRKALQDGAS